MSWWVTDYIAVSEDETQQLCNIQADAVSDLPAQDQTSTAGFIFVRGSKASVLDTSGKYIMNSSGQWILQKSGQEIEISADDIVYDNTSSGMTATTVQDAIDEIKDLDDMQDRALAELYGEDANQQLEIDYAINTGSKNKLIITNQNNTLTVNGIIFTKNDDQTITVTGTATANADYPLNTAQPLEIGQSYILSGCPNGGGVDNFLLRQQSGAIDYGDGATFTAESSSGNFYIRIRNGYAIQGSITFKPMLRAAEIKSNTFEPYAPTNRELYEGENQLQARVDQITGIGNQIPSNADLNTYYDIGMYQILSTAIAQTLVNIPSDCKVAGSIEVKILNGSARIQFYYPNWASSGTNPGSFYFRQRTGTTNWSAWYYFSGTQVATVQSVNSPMTLNLNRNDLNESLDTNFDLIDSIPEEEEGEEDV